MPMHFDIAPRSTLQNTEMAFAFAAPVGVGLLLSSHLIGASLFVSSIVGAVTFGAIFGCVLFLMRPIPGSITVSDEGLRLSFQGVKVSLAWDELDVASARHVAGPAPRDARLACVSDPERTVLIDSVRGGVVALSPIDPAAFIRALARVRALQAA